MKDGELVQVTRHGSGIDEFPNSAGAIARRGRRDSLFVCVLVTLIAVDFSAACTIALLNFLHYDQMNIKRAVIGH